MALRMKKSGKQILALTLALCVFFLSSGTVFADEEYETDMITAYSGAKMIPQALSLTGAATTSVPIMVPPGRANLAPQLALAYNSYAKDGIAGLGWNISVPFIQRNTKDGLDCSADNFVVNGSVELVDRSAEWGANHFGAKIEGQFIKFCRYTGDDYWVGTATNGAKYYYGYTADADSKQTSTFCGDSTVKWYLDRVEDANGNYMTYDYFIDNGTVYLSAIQYTGNSAESVGPANSVTFVYEDRPDAPRMYPFNEEVRLQKRLTQIQAKGNGDPVRRYDLAYSNPTDGLSSGRSLLSSVTQYGYDDSGVTHALPSQAFTYHTANEGFAPAEKWVNSYPWYDCGAHAQPFGFADFNGDGRNDFWYVNEVEFYNCITAGVWVRLANDTGTGFESASLWTDDYGFNLYNIIGTFLDDYGFASYVNISIAMENMGFGDFNGDGKVDLWFLSNTDPSTNPLSVSAAQVMVGFSDGSSFSVCWPWATMDPVPLPLVGMFGVDQEEGIHFSSCRGVADFNGDGNQDFWYVTRDWKVLVGLSNGSGPCGTLTEWHEMLPKGQYWYGWYHGVADFNGDGKADFWEVASNNQSSSGELGKGMYVALSTGAGFGPRHQWEDLDDVVSDSWNMRLWRGLADFNGDGKMDFWYIPNGTDDITVCLSTGDPDQGFATPEVWGQYWTSIYNRAGMGFTDINGDGRADYYRSDNSDREVNVALSTGEGFGTMSVWADMPNNATNTRRNFVDLTGDGKKDLWYQYYAEGVFVCTADASPFDLLETVENGMGGSFSLDYAPSSQYTNICLPAVLQTLSSLTASDGLGDSYTTTYDYENGYFDYETKDFRGFEYVTQTNPDQTWQKTQFVIDDEYLKGKPLVSNTYPPSASPDDPDAQPLLTITNTWESEPIGADENSVLPRIVSRRTETYVDGVTSYTQEDYTYADLVTDDEFYNQTTVVSSGTGLDETLTKVTTLENIGGWNWRLDEDSLTGSGESTPIRQTDYSYDTNGNLIEKVLDPDGAAATFNYTYDNYGNLITKSDAENNLTTFVYDSTVHTFPVEIHMPTTNGVPHVVYKTYDYRRGKVATETGENGHTTTYTYDPFGRVERVDGPPNASGQYSQVAYVYYDDAAPNKKVVAMAKEDPAQEWTRVGDDYSSWLGYGIDSYTWFDGLGRKIKTQSTGVKSVGGTPTNTNVITELFYDNYGRQHRVEGPYFEGDDPYPQVQTYYHSEMPSKPTRIETYDSALGAISTQFAYSGLATTVTDPDGGKKTNIKDCQGNLIEVIEYADSGAEYHTTYDYNAAGELTHVTDALNNVTTIEYNTLGQKIAMDDPDMGQWYYTYTLNGNLLTQTDPMAQEITFSYDELGRVTDKTYSANGDAVSYTYDNLTAGANGSGRLYQVSTYDAANPANAYVTTTYDTYDETGAPTQVTREIQKENSSPRTYTSWAEYDILGRPSSVVYPDTHWVIYNYYDHSGLLASVEDPTSAVIYAYYSSYTAAGQTEYVDYGNTVTHTYYYDPQSKRLDRFITDNTTTTPETVMQDRTYSYTAAGDIASIADGLTGLTKHYTYDKLHRLKSETMTESGGTYPMATSFHEITFDDYSTGPVHGVNTVTLDSLTQVQEEQSYTYDANGGMTAAPDFTDPEAPATRTITYNADNMPVSINHPTHGATTFVYDGDGSRALKSHDLSDTYYVSGAYQVSEYNGAVSATTKFIFAGNNRIAMIKNISGSEVVCYFHTDHLGSTTVLTDSSGQVVANMDYLPFGGDRIASTGNATTNYKFTGQEQDPEIGLYNYNARLYDPMAGLFVSADTVVPDFSDPQSLNRYIYCRNNPMMYVDPSGHTPWGAIVGAIMGGVSAGIQTDWDFESVVVGVVVGAIAGAVGDCSGSMAADYVSTTTYSNYAGFAGSAVGSTAGGATGGGLNAAYYGTNIGEGIVQGAAYGAISGIVGYGVSQADIFNIEGGGAVGLTNPIANATGAYVASEVLGGDSSMAAKSAFCSSVAANVGMMSYNQIKSLKSSRVPQSGVYKQNRMLDIWRPAAITLQIMGIGHSGFVNGATHATKELQCENGRSIVREYSSSHPKNSVNNFGDSFGTTYEPLNVNYNNIATPGDIGKYNLGWDNCNTWTESQY